MAKLRWDLAMTSRANVGFEGLIRLYPANLYGSAKAVPNP
jgi:hypothetical protein